MIAPADSKARPLLEHHHRLVAASAISRDVADARGYWSATRMADLKRIGFGDAQRRVPALVVPIWDVDGNLASYQIRPDEPRIVKGKPVKYETPSGSGMVLDLHPFARDRIGDPSLPLLVTEGVRKADAAVSAGLCCVALLGVWNWRGTNANGGKAALPDWERVALNGRRVFVVFDSDVMLKPAVHAALERLGGFLGSRGADVAYVYLPPGEAGAKTGLDDFLASGRSADDLLSLAARELRASRTDPTDEGPYAATATGIVYRKPVQDGAIEIPLANFNAVIAEDVVEDDGVDDRRFYRIEATVRDRAHRLDVPAAQFAGMGWVGEQLGAGAIVSPGVGNRDHLRAAIQWLSGEIPESRVYVHTGWRETPHGAAYLHAGGAVGAEGSVAGVSVSLRGPLGRYRLPDQFADEDLRAGVRAAINLFELLPPPVAVPVLGAAWIAPLRELLGDVAPDFVVWLHGASGTFKSEVAALAQAFFGDFTRLSLPANFLTTANALERLAFEAKDALLVVDDYHPAGDLKEVQAMAQVANRLLRGAGNASGRTRMRADTSLRAAYPPRCVALATGERLPDGHSNTARMFPVPVMPTTIDPDRLADAQERRHLYPLAMVGYLQYLAAHFDELRAGIPQRFQEVRQAIQAVGGHRREPGQIAHLLLGIEQFLGFAVQIGELSTVDRDALVRDARLVLVAHAREHAEVQADESPERLFARLLADGFASKRAYLQAKDGGEPTDAEQWGWETVRRVDRAGNGYDETRHPPAAALVGAIDGDWVLLYPDAAYQFVNEACRRMGRVMPVDQSTLVRRLDEAGLILTEVEGGERRRRVKAWIGRSGRRVLKLRRSAVDGILGGDERTERDFEDDARGRGGAGFKTVGASGVDQEPAATKRQGPDLVSALLPGFPGFPGTDEEVAEWRG